MILYENIWKKFNCEIFSYPLNLILFNTFFDFNVNTTIKIINKCLGVKSEDFQSKLLLENDISECICKNRIHRRNIVIPIYQNKIEYNVLALSKDKELLQLCNDKDF